MHLLCKQVDILPYIKYDFSNDESVGIEAVAGGKIFCGAQFKFI